MITVATLRAAGLTEAQIVRVLEIEQTERLAAQRERNRINQQNHRARKHVSADTADTGDRGISPSLLTSLSSSVSQKERSQSMALGGGARQQKNADSEFATFWQQYPHKVGKRAAQAKFAAARKRASMDEIMAGLARYAAKTDDRPWCNPETWLNQDRWNDQPGPPQEGRNGQGRKDDPRHSIRGVFDKLSERWGPGWEDEARELSRQVNLRVVPGGSGE